MENSSKSLSSADISERLNEHNSAPSQVAYRSLEEQEVVDYDNPYFEAAAVLVTYEPSTIKPVTGETFSGVSTKLNELIGSSQLVIDTSKTNTPTPDDMENSTQISYFLKDDIRKVVLSRLQNKNKIQLTLDANKAQTNNPSNALQYMFSRCLLNDIPELEDLNLEQMNALCRISDWLSDMPGIPPKEKIRHRIQIMEMLTPFKHLTGKYINGVFVEQFRGRRDKLSILRRYVGVAPPQGNFEAFERAIRSSPIIEKIFDLTKRPPLLIHGLGGVGKSTLLAKFILDHVEAHSNDRFPFVYLDFDRPNLSVLESDTLLIEAARQLAIQYNDNQKFHKHATGFYEKWNAVYNSVTGNSHTEYISIKADAVSQQLIHDKLEIQSEFISLIKELSEMETRPFLMILDTFEEVQYKGIDFIDEMYKFMTQLQLKYPLLRTIVAGRAKISHFKTEELELDDLDDEAAEAYLQKLGNFGAEDAHVIAKRIGGNPLTLKLATEVVKEMGMDKLKETQLTEKRFYFFERRLSELQIQGILYERILGHIHNPNVYKLAYPGLVLRTITPELILKVLNKPCKLDIKTIQEAKALFEETSREVSLITREGNLLRHRQDVRKVMLKLIRQSKPDIVNEIHELAVIYYSQFDGKAERAEEIYHSLSLDKSPRELESRWIDGVQDYLMSAIDELPPKAQAYLAARTGIENIDLAIWDTADMADKERFTIRKVADLLNSGFAEKALKLINDNTKETKSGLLPLFAVKAFSHLGQFQNALDKAVQVINDTSFDFSPQIRKELMSYIEKLHTSIEKIHSEKNMPFEKIEDEENGWISNQQDRTGMGKHDSNDMTNYSL